MILPDLPALLERHGLYLIGLEVQVRADGSAPTVDEVRTFLAARRVLAGIAPGSRYASNAAVVINVAAYEDDTIAVATDSGELGRGQTVEAFFAGLAHSLRTELVADEDTLVSITGELGPYEGSETPLSIDSLTITGPDSPQHVLLGALASMPEQGHYGLVGGRGVVLPAQGMALHGGIAEVPGARAMLPLLSFERSGEVRSINLYGDTSEDPHVTINSGPDYEAVSAHVPGTAWDIEQGLAKIPRLLCADEGPLPKKRGDKKAKASHASAVAAYELLVRAGGELSQSQPQELFSNVARLMGYPAEVASLVQAFDAPTFEPDRHSLAAVPAAPEGSGFVHTTGVVGALEVCEKIGAKAKAKGRAVDVIGKARTRTLALLGIYALLVLGVILANVIPALSTWLDIEHDIFTRLFSVFLVLGFGFTAVSMWAILKGLDQARETYASLSAKNIPNPLSLEN